MQLNMFHINDTSYNSNSLDFNSSLDIQGEHKTAFHIFSDIVGVALTGIICLLGVCGNILSFIVIRRTFINSPMFYVLGVLAVSDGLFLLSVFIIQIVVNLHPTIGIFYACFYYRAYIQYYVWPIMLTTQMTSVWLTVLVSCERYVAICYPLRVASLCTVKKVRGAVIVIFLTSALFNVPRYLEFSASVDSAMEKTDIGTNELYRYMYTCVLYAISLFFLPLLALFFLNVQLVIALQRGKKQWQALQSRQRCEQNLTIIPLSIVSIFFLCGTPSLVVNISDSVDPTLSSPFYLALMVFANFLVVLNSASNIVVYFLLGRKFRSGVAEVCCCRRRGGVRGSSRTPGAQSTMRTMDNRDSGTVEA